ncbi:MAG: hypothetical protein EU531_01545 [Promethearchaeota archaeon]|nr:MAG: hypothetical protein EU531_01545 [Candidatus Lokiarchaeota archaeon]
MRINFKHTVLGLLVLNLVVISFCLINSPKSSLNMAGEYEIEQDEFITDLKTSSTWNFTSLIIDDTGATGNYTWSEAVALPWCSGSGTEGSPYIIDDIAIQDQTTTCGLEIRNSNAHFLINNSEFGYWVGQFGIGIKLTNCTNGKLANNYFNRINYSIYLDNCNSTNLIKNKFNAVWVNAITLNNSHNNLINQNIIPNSFEWGISLIEGSTNNIISGNIMNSNNWGIGVGGENNEISENLLTYSDVGIMIYGNYNNISDNDVLNSYYGGIEISSSNNIISGNTINANYCGLWNSGNNNLIIDNVINQNEIFGISSAYYNNSIIRNQINENIEDGLILQELNNNTISDNTISHNGKFGIHCESSTDVLFKHNFISRNEHQNLIITSCHNLTILGNTIEYQSCEVNLCSNISILANTFKDALLYLHHSNYNLIQGNTMSENRVSLSDSSYNIIKSNIISVDMKLYGIYLSTYSNNNTITGNTITYEQGGCISEDESCTGNTIENNSCTQRIISGFEIIVLFSSICITSVGLIFVCKKKFMFKKF